MAEINVDEIQSGVGIEVYVGSYDDINAPDGNGNYVGIDKNTATYVGATTGGVKVKYEPKKKDVFCDQKLSAIKTRMLEEAQSIEFEMLESSAENMRIALGQYVSDDTTAGKKITGVGGVNEINYRSIMFEVPEEDENYKTTYTFFKAVSNGFETTIGRENEITYKATFNLYADTSSGHQGGQELCSICVEVPTP